MNKNISGCFWYLILEDKVSVYFKGYCDFLDFF